MCCGCGSGTTPGGSSSASTTPASARSTTRRSRLPTDRPCAIAVMDLDRFKEVNDTLGHANGDRLLVALTDRLQGAVRDGDMLARVGGDEFGVVLPGIHGPSEAVEVLNRIRVALTE